MVVDTSVLIHLAFREEGWQRSFDLLTVQTQLVVSAVSLVEAHAVIKGRGRTIRDDPEVVIDRLLSTLGVVTVSLDARQMVLARRAYSRYGKEGHPAQLNFGDVLVYALAASRDEVLALTGQDFSQTDLEVVALPLG